MDSVRSKALFKRTILENPFLVNVLQVGKDGKEGCPSKKQTQFLAYMGKEALFGGAAGGGKSQSLLMAALQFVEVPGYAALLLRRTYDMLKQDDGLIARSKKWLANTGAKYHETDHKWTFPSGATLTFGYLDHDKHLDRYQGGAWQFCGWDELTQVPESRYLYLFSRVRRPDKCQGPLGEVPLRIRAASNPGGIGHEYCKRRFITGVDPKYFVPAVVADNPGLDVKSYIESLINLDPIKRAQLLAGDWDAYEGGRFKEKWFRYFNVQRDHANVPRYYLSRGGLGSSGEFDYGEDGIPVYGTYNVIICDPACTEKDVSEGGDPDPTAIGVFAITPKNDILVLQMVRKWLDIDDIPKEIAKLCRGYNPAWVGIEDNGFAIGITRACQKAGITVKSLSPEGKGKLVRATPAIIRCEAGQIYLPERGTQSWDVDLCLDPACRHMQQHGTLNQDNRPRCKQCGGPVDEAWCADFVSELVQFTGNEKMDAHDDQCLAAGTMIATDHGERPIETIKAGDMVLTRKGYRRVLAACMTNADAERMAVMMGHEWYLKGTKNHPVFTSIGMKRLDELTYADKLMVCKNTSSISTESGLPATLNPSTSTCETTSSAAPITGTGSAICTKQSGSRSPESQSRLATKSITRTGTRSTTTPGISNASRPKSIAPDMAAITQECVSILPVFGHSPKPGMVRTRGGNGTQNMPRKIGRAASQQTEFAKSATSRTSPCPDGPTTSSALTTAAQNNGENQASITSNGPVPSAEQLSSSTSIQSSETVLAPVLCVGSIGRGPVYNLTVEGEHEYFANGILCHNCDVLGYLVQALHGMGLGGPLQVKPFEEEEYLTIRETTAGGLLGWTR